MYTKFNHKPVVFYLEDDHSVHESMVFFLKLHFENLYCFFDGLEALKEIDNGVLPDLIISDIQMPKCDGLQFVTIIRDRGIDVPVIFLTAYLDIEYTQQALRLDIGHYELKPIKNKDDFLRKCYSLLDEYLKNRLNSITLKNNKMRILYLEDDSIIAKSVSSTLKLYDYIELDTAANGEEAIDLIEQNKFNYDVIISDIRVPGVSGLDVISYLKKNNKNIYTIITTGFNESEYLLKALELKADKYFIKPISIIEILELIHKEYSLKLELIKAEQLSKELQIKNKRMNENLAYTISDKDGVIIDVSEHFCEATGYRKYELINHNHNILSSNETPQEVYKNLWETINNFQSWNGEIKNRKKDGTLYWTFVSIMPEYDISGNHIGFISIQNDITVKKALEIQEKKLAEQERLSMLGEMFDNIAHQWKQPLNVISIIATGIEMKVEFDKISKEYLLHATKDIVYNTQYLSETITTFKNYVQGKKEYLYIDIQREINQALTIIKPMLKTMNYIELISNHTHIDPIRIALITNELSQVIITIINNAKDALIEHHIEDPWIKLDLSQSDHEVFITIEDNGGGIPENVLPHIFDKYYTTKSEDKGTGLGLFMSKEIVEESLHGKLEVNNSSNGAIFTITLSKDLKVQ